MGVPLIPLLHRAQRYATLSLKGDAPAVFTVDAMERLLLASPHTLHRVVRPQCLWLVDQRMRDQSACGAAASRV